MQISISSHPHTSRVSCQCIPKPTSGHLTQIPLDMTVTKRRHKQTSNKSPPEHGSRQESVSRTVVPQRLVPSKPPTYYSTTHGYSSSMYHPLKLNHQLFFSTSEYKSRSLILCRYLLQFVRPPSSCNSSGCLQLRLPPVPLYRHHISVVTFTLALTFNSRDW